MSEATKNMTRWGGECYTTSCPFHYYHAKGDEPLCNAENAVVTDEEFAEKAICKQLNLIIEY